MEPGTVREPLPKLVWAAAVLALLNAAYLIFVSVSGQVYVALPLALIPLLAGIGILRRNIWSARGFGLFQLCQIVLVVFLAIRGHVEGTKWIGLIGSAFFTLLLAWLFFAAAGSLVRVHGRRGRPEPWIALSVLFVIPWLFFQAFVIPSGAMEDTLLIGDSVMVQRLPRPSIARDEIVVFPYPLNRQEEFVKRIAGMPGDRLRIVNKELYRNAAKVNEPYAVHKTTYVDAYRDNFPSPPNTRLPDSAMEMLASHVVNGELVVPPGKCFVMGDSRDDSLDSRYFGFVDISSILGRPILIYNSVARPFDGVDRENRGRVRWNRIFRIVR